jgi:hypothetical protein
VFVVAVETVHTLFSWIYLYHLSVDNFGNPNAFVENHFTLVSGALFDSIIGAYVQGYFLHRLFILSGRQWWTLVGAIAIAAQIGTSLAFSIIGSKITLAEFELTHSDLVTVVLVCNVVIDLWNTGGLCYFLWQGKTGLTSYAFT